MKRKIHLIKIFFLRIKWYFDMIHFAKSHSKEVDNYKFLIDIRKVAYDKMLEIQRTDPENHKDVDKLTIQLDLIDNILKYTNGNK